MYKVGRGKICTKFYLQIPKETDSVEDLGVRMRMTIKGILKNFMSVCGYECNVLIVYQWHALAKGVRYIRVVVK
jgi:hypothetical protein